MTDKPEKISATTLKLPLALGSGETLTLGECAGKWLVLYFYPKDNTPGCTTEGLDFNALLPEFEKLNARILGVSKDSVRSHAGFTRKHGFAFDLISDADEALCRAFGVIQMKKLYGREYEGIVRSTFLIDPQSRIVEVWQPVKVPGHAAAVLESLRRHHA
ncbi:peroxiredoxin [Lysobacteraceae bacterium NML120232]|nr:peroxiredoxin [Xanthomonadaceae bacterium NML08-0793]PJK10673.1 peroxiredoxin [Xanthomonadaceae bacterium NML120232]